MKLKRDVTLIVISIISLLIIAGCSGGGGVSSGSPTTPFLGGTQGLEIGFLEGSPPDEVTDGDTFDFQAIVRLKNTGEHDLGAADVKIDLIGFMPEDFRSDDADFVNGDLLGKNPEEGPTAKEVDSEGNIIEPIEVFKTFPKTGKFFKYKESIRGNVPFVFRADVCYKYQTEAVSGICILGDMVNIDDDALCDSSESKSVFSSGSPIQVNSFRQSVVGRDKTQFSFDIVHSGSGNVFGLTKNSIDFPDPYCPKKATYRRQSENKVKVKVVTGLTKMIDSEESLDCVGLDDISGSTTASQEGTVTLVDGKRTVTCIQTLETTRGDFEKNVDITLDFNYFDSVDKNVLVKHLI